MDSANSGSKQSSSGGDEQELDSSSSFFNPSPNFSTISTPHPHLLTHQNPTLFDPQHTQNLDHALYNNNNINNDLIWSRGLLSQQHNYPNINNLTTTSTSSSPLPISRTQSLASTQPGPFPSPLDPDNHASRASTRPDHLSGVIKNPKKRTRASNRAPTTVLKTNTTNFRQMVQEFTGINPAAAFPGSPYSRRPDMFAGLRPVSHLDNLGPLYPIRPSAHMILSPFSPHPNPLLNSTMIDSIVPTTNIVSTNNPATTTNIGASTSDDSNSYPQLITTHLLNQLQQDQNQNDDKR